MSRQPYLIRITERRCQDPQEESAMLRIRAAALEYRAMRLEAQELGYSFCLRDRASSVQLAWAGSNQALDLLIKRDPLFPYSEIDVTPVIDTEWLIQEAQDYLGEEIISGARASQLVHPQQEAREDRSYFLVWKEVRPFSPLLAEAIQDDIYRRTVRSQDAHENNRLKFADHNPVGQQVGILIGCGSEAEVMAHVRNCEVFPDTVVTCEALLTLSAAFTQCCNRLIELRRAPPVSTIFQQTLAEAAA